MCEKYVTSGKIVSTKHNVIHVVEEVGKKLTWKL
jgi:hypothetical protein